MKAEQVSLRENIFMARKLKKTKMKAISLIGMYEGTSLGTRTNLGSGILYETL